MTAICQVRNPTTQAALFFKKNTVYCKRHHLWDGIASKFCRSPFFFLCHSRRNLRFIDNARSWDSASKLGEPTGFSWHLGRFGSLKKQWSFIFFLFFYWSVICLLLFFFVKLYECTISWWIMTKRENHLLIKSIFFTLWWYTVIFCRNMLSFRDREWRKVCE